MNEIPPIITERVDDIPLLLEQMQRMSLPSLLDDHFPTHGNWQGLSLGWVATIWLSSILSRGDHRLVHVEPWVGNRLWTLRATTGQAVERLDFTDDRLEIVLHSLHDDTRWTACEAALNRHTVRVYELPTARVHVDSTSASGYTTVSENGLFQFGHSKDYRPDLPQVKVMQAVLDPLGMPLATDVVSGEGADEPGGGGRAPELDRAARGRALRAAGTGVGEGSSRPRGQSDGRGRGLEPVRPRQETL